MVVAAARQITVLFFAVQSYSRADVLARVQGIIGGRET